MKFYRSLFLIVFLSTFVDASNVNEEYKIEMLIYKYNEIKTEENFDTELIKPSANSVIKYQGEANKNKLSNFSNISNYFENIINKNTNLSSDIYPKTLYRDDEEIEVLKKLKKNISADKDKTFLDSKSWIQTIPNYENSKYLSYSDTSNYGFYMKFYKKRFLHIELIGYLDEQNNIYNRFINIEDRIFNEGVYFFDHPYFGMIVSINEI